MLGIHSYNPHLFTRKHIMSAYYAQDTDHCASLLGGPSPKPSWNHAEGTTRGYTICGQQVAGWGWGGTAPNGELPAKGTEHPHRVLRISINMCKVGQNRKVG